MDRRTVNLSDGGYINIAESTAGIDIDLVNKTRKIFDRIALRDDNIFFIDVHTREEIDNVVTHLREVEQFLPVQVRKALGEKMNTPSRIVICSVCGTPLKPIPNLLNEFKQSGWAIGGNPSTEEWQQWLGTVCSSCKKVYSPNCCDARGGPCPKCGRDVKPAMSSFLP